MLLLSLVRLLLTVEDLDELAPFAFDLRCEREDADVDEMVERLSKPLLVLRADDGFDAGCCWRLGK